MAGDGRRKETLAFETLTRDLRRIFDTRLTSVVAYGEPDDDGAHKMALVERSAFVRRARTEPPVPDWKRMTWAQDYLPAADPARAEEPLG